MRYFNYHGPVNPQQHYFITRRELLAQLMVQLEQGKFFSIFASRQMGKTTFIHEIMAHLKTLPQYVGIEVSFENYGNLDEMRFCKALQREIDTHLQAVLTRDSSRRSELEAYLGAQPPHNLLDFSAYYGDVSTLLLPQQLVLVIDEFDVLPREIAERFLRSLRKIYTMRSPTRPPVFHSVALFSIRDVADVVQTGSPFNIAYKIQLQTFTPEQVAELLAQHTAETGQAFAHEVVERIYEQTGGHPFLVNRLAAILVDEIVTERSIAVSPADLSQALVQLVGERNDNFSTLLRHVNRLREPVMQILVGEPVRYNLNYEPVYQMEMYGIVRQVENFCEIANPIYKKVITENLRPPETDLQTETVRNGLDWRQYLRQDKLDIGAVLRDFARFVERRGQGAFNLTETHREATGQYLLMAYIDLLVKAVGGQTFLEVPTGRGRMDIIVVRGAERHVIEMKIWRGVAELEAGQEQLARYLGTEEVNEGHLVVFHARPQVYGKMNVQELVFDVQVEEKTIHNYLVRLAVDDTAQVSKVKKKADKPH
jgi:AAA+ ATPase superfamily predicted ATPase